MGVLNRQKRIHREVPGVVQCGVGPDFIDYDVQLRTDNGEMRVGVRLARMLLEDSQFVSWSAPELALLWFLQCGVPPELGLRTGTRWCDCANLHGAGPIARMLAQLTGRHQDQLHDRVVRSLGYFSGIFGAQSLLNGIVNGREVARHVTAVLPGVASKNIMSDMQASCWMQTLGSREFPQHALQAIHENALWDPMSKTLATARCDCGVRIVGVRRATVGVRCVRIVGVRRAHRGRPPCDHPEHTSAGRRAMITCGPLTQE